jgi:ketosteroid isomerase-like protein
VASANVDFVRSLYAAWERGDWSSVEWAHPEIEFVAADGPTPGSSRGLASMGEFWREFLSTWEDYRVEAEDYRELEGDRVLVFIRIRGRGKTSGLEVGRMGAKGANLFHLRDGKVARLALYFDRGRALADVGLTPGGDSPYES